MDCPCCVGKKCAMHFYGLNEDCECICDWKKLRAFVTAVEEYATLHGDHDGPCTNVGNEAEDPCELHWDMTKKREKAILDLLPGIKKIIDDPREWGGS